MTSPAPVRCAIYTRKSTEEGLDQGFNTLDAQHECAVSLMRTRLRFLRRRVLRLQPAAATQLGRRRGSA